MSAPDQSEELQQLREQLAALTRRVYELEQILRTRTPATQLSGASPPPEQVTATPPAPRYEPPAPPSHQPAPFAPEPSLAAPEPPLPTFLRQAAQSAKKPPTRVNANAGISLESRIGGQWLNRIGIVAVLVGLSYFLKLAFENNWIGPTTQVLIGMVAGTAILLWSERFRSKGYPAFAYSLKALAIGALYLSLWAASQYYHLVPPPVSFFGMVLVTLIYAGLSLRQSSELLAAYALSSGFLAPVLISTGENHEIALFSYLLLLDLGTAWIVAIRKWQRLLYGSLTGTAALFLAWETGYYTPPQLTRTLIFLAVFFLLYTLIAARENSEILAAIALGCGLGAVLPIFPQREQEVALLIYLAVLDIAALWLTSSQTWRRLLAGSFAGTVALFFAWSVTYYTEQELVITLAFATFFFLLYMGAPFLGETPPRRRHYVELTGVALLNAAAYFTACYLMLDHAYRPQLVWLTLVAAALYFVLMRLLRTREQPDTPLFAPLYLAIAIGFITVAIPLKFGGHWLALGWLAEAAALFWAAHRSKILLLRVLGVAALALGVARLVGVDSQAHQDADRESALWTVPGGHRSAGFAGVLRKVGRR